MLSFIHNSTVKKSEIDVIFLFLHVLYSQNPKKKTYDVFHKFKRYINQKSEREHIFTMRDLIVTIVFIVTAK